MRPIRKYEKTIAVLLALTAWQLIAARLDFGVLLASPVSVATRVFSMLGEKDAWLTAGLTLSKIMTGFLLAFFVGCALSSLSARFHAFEALVWPYIAVVKSTPVASFIVLCLVWLSTDSLSTFIAFLMAMPVIYQSMLAGIKSIDKKSLQMADVFGLSLYKRFKFIYIPGVKSHLISSASVAIGLSWKAGVAAEVIGIPAGSIGERLYQAKLYIDTKDLFAWTVVVVALSIAMEKTVMFIIKRLYAALEASK